MFTANELTIIYYGGQIEKNQQKFPNRLIMGLQIELIHDDHDDVDHHVRHDHDHVHEHDRVHVHDDDVHDDDRAHADRALLPHPLMDRRNRPPNLKNIF